MAVSHKKFRNAAGEEVRAIRVTERNYINVMNWVSDTKSNHDHKAVAIEHVSKDGDVSNQRIKLHVHGVGIRVARVGDWIIRTAKDGVGYVFKVGKDEFPANYKQV